MIHTEMDADGTIHRQWDDGEPDWVPAPDPVEVFSARLREELPAATTLTKLRASLVNALDDLDAARTT